MCQVPIAQALHGIYKVYNDTQKHLHNVIWYTAKKTTTYVCDFDSITGAYTMAIGETHRLCFKQQ